MRLYNTIKFRCPHGCGEIEVQSKAGDHGTEECQTRWIVTNPMPINHVFMGLYRTASQEDES